MGIFKLAMLDCQSLTRLRPSRPFRMNMHWGAEMLQSLDGFRWFRTGFFPIATVVLLAHTPLSRHISEVLWQINANHFYHFWASRQYNGWMLWFKQHILVNYNILLLCFWTRSAKSMARIRIMIPKFFGRRLVNYDGWFTQTYDRWVSKCRILIWLVVTGTMEFYDFPETVGNIIIPTDEVHHFSEG